MCGSCWEQLGCPVLFDTEIEECARLINELYELCPTGGPLHCELDDMNLGALQITPMYAIPASANGMRKAIEDDYSEEVHRICDRIAELMNGMTEGQRASAVAHHEGWVVGGVPALRAGDGVPITDHTQP